VYPATPTEPVGTSAAVDFGPQRIAQRLGISPGRGIEDHQVYLEAPPEPEGMGREETAGDVHRRGSPHSQQHDREISGHTEPPQLGLWTRALAAFLDGKSNLVRRVDGRGHEAFELGDVAARQPVSLKLDLGCVTRAFKRPGRTVRRLVLSHERQHRIAILSRRCDGDHLLSSPGSQLELGAQDGDRVEGGPGTSAQAYGAIRQALGRSHRSSSPQESLPVELPPHRGR
jgi:hypothetical protein